MKNRLFQFVLAVLASHHMAISQTPQDADVEDVPPQTLFEVARIKSNQEDFNSALNLLGHAFREGYPDPMKVVRTTDFQPLIDHPDYRQKLRELIKQYATRNHTTMVRPNEPGEGISVSGQLQSEGDHAPIANAAIEFVHTDKDGFYFKEKSPWNPRLFAYVKTNATGEFSVNTIMPGPYRDDSGDLSYSHIHFAISSPGFTPYNSEFTFENDPVLNKTGNPDGVPVAVMKRANGRSHYHVIIRLRRN